MYANQRFTDYASAKFMIHSSPQSNLLIKWLNTS